VTKPTYLVEAWREDPWWLARVIDGPDAAALGAVTQARSKADVEPMARDLIATILDCTDAGFDLKIEYK